MKPWTRRAGVAVGLVLARVIRAVKKSRPVKLR